MLSYLAYNMRFSGEQSDGYAENLILSALRLLQDCPSNGIALRKVISINVVTLFSNWPSIRNLWSSFDT